MAQSVERKAAPRPMEARGGAHGIENGAPLRQDLARNWIVVDAMGLQYECPPSDCMHALRPCDGGALSCTCQQRLARSEGSTCLSGRKRGHDGPYLWPRSDDRGPVWRGPWPSILVCAFLPHGCLAYYDLWSRFHRLGAVMQSLVLQMQRRRSRSTGIARSKGAASRAGANLCGIRHDGPDSVESSRAQLAAWLWRR